MNHTHPKSLAGNNLKLILGPLFLAVASLIVVACSDFKISGTLPTPGATKVTVVVTDPATCLSPNGPYSHVYVTVAAVRANPNESAVDSDSGWVDLTPNLSAGPMQVDLLGTADKQCFLATLGENPDVPPTAYKQIKVFLAANNATLSANACGTSTSCVVLASDSSVHPLDTSAEATTGIKLTTREILSKVTGEGFPILANESTNLNINFLACESIIQDGQGSYRLKPVVNASEAKSSSHSLHGTVRDGGTGQAVKGSVMVALTRQDGTGVQRVWRTALAEADGSFVFCPRPTGTFDVVIVGTRDDGVFYQPSIIAQILEGTSNIGHVNLYPLTSSADSTVTLTGKVASQTASRAGTSADITVSVLEKAPTGEIFTIPMPPTPAQSSATLNVATAAPGSTLTCPTHFYCADYSIQVPAGSANYANFHKDGPRLKPNDTLPTYVIDSVAFIPSSGGVLNCTAHPLRTDPLTPSAGGVTLQVPTIEHSYCQ